MNRLIAFFACFFFLAASLPASAQELSIPILMGTPAPFSGILLPESHATQCIADAAAVDRLTVEVAARARELEVSTRLREAFEQEQSQRIAELSSRSWWDENGNLFMFGLGLVLGVAASVLGAVALSR